MRKVEKILDNFRNPRFCLEFWKSYFLRLAQIELFFKVTRVMLDNTSSCYSNTITVAIVTICCLTDDEKKCKILCCLTDDANKCNTCSYYILFNWWEFPKQILDFGHFFEFFEIFGNSIIIYSIIKDSMTQSEKSGENFGQFQKS